MVRVLIVGNANDSHNKRFLRQLNKSDYLDIHIFSYVDMNDVADIENKLFVKRKIFPHSFYKIPKISLLFETIDIFFTLQSIKRQNYYDVISINYMWICLVPSRNILRKMCNKLMITPFGSDVYRISKYEQYQYCKVYKKADYVVSSIEQFKRDLQKKFNIPINKFVNLRFGSDIIDFILTDNSTKEIAKQYFNIKDYYVISCGYNGSVQQNHDKIITEILKIKNKLPYNYILLFQMTYPKSNNIYIDKIEGTLKKYNIKYLILSDYLSDIEVVKLRKATDLFIHIQDTDAYSGSVQEYLLSGAKVINAAWLNYPDLEIDGYPYYIVNKFEDLSDVILFSIKDNSELLTKRVKNIIKEKSWNYQGNKWVQFLTQKNG